MCSQGVEGVIDLVVSRSLNRTMVKKLKWHKEKVWEDVESPPKSRLKWMDTFCRQKGVEHALDIAVILLILWLLDLSVAMRVVDSFISCWLSPSSSW